MVSTIFFLLFALLTAAAQQTQFNITRGFSLKPTNNSSWLSPSGLYAFGFYQQGNGYAIGIFIAKIPQKTVVWTANRDDPLVSENATLLFANNGRLILQSTGGKETNIADSPESASSASMLDSGNFVLYNYRQEIIWQSFEHPTDTLVPRQRLLTNGRLVSSISETNHSTGLFLLVMQGDGNLVQYPLETISIPSAYFATMTVGRENVSLNFDADGLLYLLDTNGSNIMNLTKGGYSTDETIYIMRIDADGIQRLYSHNLKLNSSWSIEWQSSDDKCVAKGLCGLNGFCVLNDLEAECKCLPGYTFVKQGTWAAGCKRNFTAEICNSKNESMTYRIEALPNTVWEDVPYFSLSSSTTREDCEKACLEDCNCEAALYKDGNCRKQRPPLKFGRRQLSDTNIALIKVGVSAPTSTTGKISPRESKKGQRIDILIIGVSLVVFGSILLVIFGTLIYINHGPAYNRLSDSVNVGTSEDVTSRSFTFAELEKMTHGFKEEIGRGAFGRVYKGVLLNGQKFVAIKRLEKLLAEGEGEFQNEVKVIGRTHHRNLVRLLGYCIDGPNRLLVYEYMGEGSLADALFTPGKQPCWNEKIDFSRNIARGILYLHEECETQIIHCDIKPQNILLDENRRAKLSDFGLAKLLRPDQTRIFTGIRGTKGYVAPEWHKNQPVTVKADVYSFGIVLLEIICCRRSVDWTLSEEEAVLEEWVYDCFEAGQLQKLVGDEEVDEKQLERMVKVGLWCILEEPSLRPSMKKVLLMLEGAVDIPIPPNPTCFFSTA